MTGSCTDAVHACTSQLPKPVIWNVHQPQVLQQSGVVTINKCVPAPDCVAARKSGPCPRCVVSSTLDIVLPKPSRLALCEVPGRKVNFVGFHRLSLSGSDTVHGWIDRRVLQRGLLRMRSVGTCLVVLWVMTSYSLAGDLEETGEWRRLHNEELHDLHS